MKNTGSILLVFAVIAAQFMLSGCKKNNPESASEQIQYLPFSEVNMADGFWKPRIDNALDVTVPHIMKMCLEAGYVNNFAIVAGLEEGEYKGLTLWDETLYKAIEAASYSLKLKYNSELDSMLDSIISVMAKVQDTDGYIDSHVQYSEQKGVWPKSERFNRENRSLELYHCGHLIEAAVAHFQATGKKTLLNLAIQYANLVDSVFGPNGKKDILGHAEIELALPRLYEVTGDERYLKLAKFFVDMRGNPERPKLYGEFLQDQLPFVQQTVATGQAPRATYLYSGAADISYYKGIPEYDQALKTLWDEVVGHKMYITGGIGSHHENEGFGEPYYLPNLTAYSEVCAAVSYSMWNTRMFKIDPNGKYFDILERTCYNNLLAGVSVSGDRYFYACPLESDGKFRFNRGWLPENYTDRFSEASATRKEWFPCACCPPNYARYLFQLPGYIYAHRGNEVFVNLYIGSNAKVPVGNHVVEISQETQYPWNGNVTIKVEPQSQNKGFTLKLRIPTWSHDNVVPGNLYHFSDSLKVNYGVKVNGENFDGQIVDGYFSITRKWKRGDVVELELPMDVRRIESNPNVLDNAGKVAVQRGPLVYCAEAVDNDATLSEKTINSPNSLINEMWDNNFDGFIRLKFQNQTGSINLLPYYLWSNRGENEMKVWMGKY